MLSKQSAFKAHEPCPQCHSKDNLARYDDGHAWCFGCGYHEVGGRVPVRPEVAPMTVLGPSTGIPDPHIRLPSDASTTIDNKALNWLSAYGITRPEIVENNIQWSDRFQQLLFPIYGDKNDLIAYQARQFYSRVDGTKFKKWLSYGKVGEILHIMGLTNPSECGIVLVEDIVSAIKVSRYGCAMPLFGNRPSMRQLMRLSRITDKVFIWLDPDMRKVSHLIAAQAQGIGLQPKVIMSNQDPKAESEHRIKQYCSMQANVFV